MKNVDEVLAEKAKRMMKWISPIKTYRQATRTVCIYLMTQRVLTLWLHKSLDSQWELASKLAAWTRPNSKYPVNEACMNVCCIMTKTPLLPVASGCLIMVLYVWLSFVLSPSCSVECFGWFSEKLKLNFSQLIFLQYPFRFAFSTLVHPPDVFLTRVSQ